VNNGMLYINGQTGSRVALEIRIVAHNTEKPVYA
jgi:hypothetical protein